MEISSLLITLRRSHQIEQTFGDIGVSSVEEQKNFNGVLQNVMNTANTPALSEEERTSFVEDIDYIIKEKADKYNLDESLIKAVIKAESGFNPNAVSKAGASGLMQLMPGTARGLGVEDIFDVEQNIEGGAKYLRGMLDRFDGDKSLALAAYNAGPNAVKRYGGIPPYQETQNYVKRVLSYERNYL